MSSYLSRAKSLSERREPMRAFYQLVNGLRKNPRDEQALEMLVDIYIRDIETPGVEQDLLKTLSIVPEGASLCEMIENTLEKSEDHRRLKSLLQTKEEQHLFQEPAPVYHEAPLDRQQTQFEPAHHTGRHTSTPLTEAPVLTVRSPDEAVLPAYEYLEPIPASSPVHAPATPPERSQDPLRADETIPHTAPPTSAPYDRHTKTSIREERATTGVFSSIDTYLEDSSAEIEEELAQKSKKRLALIALFVILAIALLIFAKPSKNDAAQEQHETTDGDTTITQPIPIVC